MYNNHSYIYFFISVGWCRDKKKWLKWWICMILFLSFLEGTNNSSNFNLRTLFVLVYMWRHYSCQDWGRFKPIRNRLLSSLRPKCTENDDVIVETNTTIIGSFFQGILVFLTCCLIMHVTYRGSTGPAPYHHSENNRGNHDHEGNEYPGPELERWVKNKHKHNPEDKNKRNELRFL